MPTLDLEVNEKVALLAFLLGLLFGAIGQRTNFCTMGAVSDWVNMGDKNRLRAWLLAIGVAILATGYLQWSGPIDLQQSIYLTPNFGWLGHLLGGLLFGIGMIGFLFADATLATELRRGEADFAETPSRPRRFGGRWPQLDARYRVRISF